MNDVDLARSLAWRQFLASAEHSPTFLGLALLDANGDGKLDGSEVGESVVHSLGAHGAVTVAAAERVTSAALEMPGPSAHIAEFAKTSARLQRAVDAFEQADRNFVEVASAMGAKVSGVASLGLTVITGFSGLAGAAAALHVLPFLGAAVGATVLLAKAHAIAQRHLAERPEIQQCAADVRELTTPLKLQLAAFASDLRGQK